MSDKQNNTSRRAFIGVTGAAAGAALVIVNVPLVASKLAFAAGSGKKHR